MQIRHLEAGGVTTLLRQDDVLESAGARRVSPRTVPMLMPNASAALISIEYGARAGAYTPVSACSSGAVEPLHNIAGRFVGSSPAQGAREGSFGTVPNRW